MTPEPQPNNIVVTNDGNITGMIGAVVINYGQVQPWVVESLESGTAAHLIAQIQSGQAAGAVLPISDLLKAWQNLAKTNKDYTHLHRIASNIWGDSHDEYVLVFELTPIHYIKIAIVNSKPHVEMLQGEAHEIRKLVMEQYAESNGWKVVKV